MSYMMEARASGVSIDVSRDRNPRVNIHGAQNARAESSDVRFGHWIVRFDVPGGSTGVIYELTREQAEGVAEAINGPAGQTVEQGAALEVSCEA